MASSIGKPHLIIQADLLFNHNGRLTSDIYPGDMGWTVNWDKPEERPEWYHNMSSVMQAGPCVRSNQLDYDEDVMYKVSAQKDVGISYKLQGIVTADRRACEAKTSRFRIKWCH